MSLIAELQRRSVFKVAAAYLVVAWLVIQVAATVAPQLALPEWAPRFITLIVLLGFPVALVIAWVFDVTPEGLKVEPAPVGTKRMFGIAALLVALAIGWYWKGSIGLAPSDADGPRALAVLPFASIGGDAESSGLAGGLHDTLITQLSKVKGLEVRSRTSVMKYKDWSGGLKPIAEELGVSVVLEGSVQRVGNRTVVNAQLIDAHSDAHLWAETIDRTGDDLFALQSEIAQRVTRALAVALSPAEQKALTVAPTQDTEAYALFIDAMRELNESDRAALEVQREAGRLKAAAIFEAAVARDPSFALAWAMLSRTYASIAWDTRELSYRDYVAKTRAAAERAVALGPDLPEARFAQGSVSLQLDFDFARAVRELRAAAEGMPSNADAQERLALALNYAGDPVTALASYQKAFELDPTGTYFYRGLRDSYVQLRRFDDARALTRRVAALMPGDYGMARDPAELERVATGDLSPLTAFVRSASAGFRADPVATYDQWLVAFAAGDPTAALAVLASAPEGARPDSYAVLRAETLRALGRGAEAAVLYAAERDRLGARLADPRDPYIEALIRADLAFVQARLDDAKSARENLVVADRLWGVQREPSDGARVWFNIVIVEVALGDTDEALRKLTWLVEHPTFYTPGRVWTAPALAELHAEPRFRALMQKHGIDVSNEPFAPLQRGAAK
jgi:TolB-like protein